jgi:hypothetical protein
MSATFLTTIASTEDAIALADLIKAVARRTDRVHGPNPLDAVNELLARFPSEQAAYIH